MPPRAASQLAERAGLSAYAPTPTSDPPTDNTETQRLLRLLLTIYTCRPPRRSKLLSHADTDAPQDHANALTGCGNSRCEPPSNTRVVLRRPRRPNDPPITLATPRALAIPRMCVAQRGAYVP
jgi:hypothetical protein